MPLDLGIHFLLHKFRNLWRHKPDKVKSNREAMSYFQVPQIITWLSEVDDLEPLVRKLITFGLEGIHSPYESKSVLVFSKYVEHEADNHSEFSSTTDKILPSVVKYWKMFYWVNTILCYTIITKGHSAKSKQDNTFATVERKLQIKLHCMLKMLYTDLHVVIRRHSNTEVKETFSDSAGSLLRPWTLGYVKPEWYLIRDPWKENMIL